MKKWLYNLFDKELFGELLAVEGIDLNIDFGDENQVGEAFDLMEKRMKFLEGDNIEIDFPEDARGFNFLRMVASMAKRGKSWYVQKESELFKKRLKTMEKKDMISFLNDNIFGGKIVRGIKKDELAYYDKRDTEGKIKVMWQYFSRLIFNWSTTVANGWIYTNSEVIINNVVTMFNRMLKKNLLKTRMKITRAGMDDLFSGYSDLIDSKVPTIIPDGTTIADVIKRSPLCMRNLDISLSHGVDIGYNGYLILSFFLKSFKERDELVQYFYERNPVNKKMHATITDFLGRRRELDYIFKQMYGLTGGGTSYKSYACNKINKELLCPFYSMTSLTEKEREKKIKEMIDAMAIDGIDNKIKEFAETIMFKIIGKGKSNRACGFELELRFQTERIIKILTKILSGTRKNNWKERIVWHPVKGYIEPVMKMEKEREKLDQR